jgi:hypothetical protein
MMRSYDNQSVRDGYGDGGERFHIVATSLVERGWKEAEIKHEIAAPDRRWRFAIPCDWDENRLQQEIERCIVKVRPLEPKQVVEEDWPLRRSLPDARSARL